MLITNFFNVINRFKIISGISTSLLIILFLDIMEHLTNYYLQISSDLMNNVVRTI